MAYSVSEGWKEQVYSGSSRYKCRLLINDVQVPITQIAKITINSPIIDNSNQNSKIFYVGSFISQSITIKFKNLDNLDIRSGNNVDLYISQYIEEDEDWEEIPIGKYLIDELGENYQKTCEITCLDYAIKFSTNCDYSSALVDGVIEIDNLLEWICDYYNVELGDYPDTNGDVVIGSYDNTLSGKSYISYIAEIKGCNAKMDREGNLTLVPLKNSPVETINALKSASWELGEKYDIEKVVYFDAIRNFTFGGGSHYLNYEDNPLYYTSNGTSYRLKYDVDGDAINTLYIRQENPFITNESVVENIYHQVYGFVAYSVKCRNYGDVSLDAWDTINYSLGNKIYPTLNNNTITYEITIMSDIDVKISTEQQEVTTNVVSGSVEQKIKKVSTKVDNIEGQISLMAQDISDNIEQIANVNIRADSIEQNVTNTSEDLQTLTSAVQNIQTSTQQQFNVINQTLENGVTLVKTTSVTIDDGGLSIGKSDSKIASNMDNKEFKVLDSSGKILTFIGYDEEEGTSKSQMDNLTITTYLVSGAHRREKFTRNGEVRTGEFYKG